LSWSEGRQAAVTSRGLRCATQATAAWLVASCGRSAGAGRAAAAARSLAGVDLAAVFERARSRHAAPGPVADPPTRPVPLILSP
ncbi:MAG TPA: hypothetical protein DD490_19365, partial [Acidobacteria bacterium]|nr:hypothetical protein [Acidobacteriota bacterium]